MNTEKIAEWLSERGIRPTANRLLVARTLMKSDRPLSLSELEARIVSIDKSGVYRSLMLLHEKHLLHAIDDGSGGVRYEFCMRTGHGEDDDLHVHFHCERCHKTFCLPDVPMPVVPLPQGFEGHGVNCVVNGLCPDCANKR